MTDRSTEYGPQQPGVFDDDRLLACALGLDDDSELLEAAAGDAALAGRLAAMRRDAVAIEERVDAAVPAPDAEYADLGDARWAPLRPYMESPRASGSRSRASRWLRVAVPLAAVTVLALAVGLVAVNRSQDSAMLENQRMATDSGSELGGAVAAPTFAQQIDGFAVVVLAKARAASGAVQRFAVVRVLKGDSPDLLKLRVGKTPADRGRLHLLMLRPLASVDAQDYEAQPSQGPAVTKGASDGPGRPLAVAYTYQGEPAVCRELAQGTDPASVSLP